MKKRICALIMVFALIITAYASDEIKVLVNGTKVVFDVEPMIIKSRTMVPVRAIFEKLGVVVGWDGENEIVYGFTATRKISLKIGENYINVNGEKRAIDSSSIIVGSRTLVPLRAVSEALSLNVEWNESSRTVTISDSPSEEEGMPEQMVLKLVNKYREEEGLSPLVWDDKLASVASAHSEDMVARDFFDHKNPDGESPFDRMHNNGINYFNAAENIAAGQRTPEAVMDSWMNSPGHRANILNPNLGKLGVGIAYGGKYGIYWTQCFTN